MKPASEGKLELELRNEEEIALELAVANYSLKPYVPGLAEVAAGWRPVYPMTVYNVSGDDTSGVAGLLKPDGEFIPVKRTRRTAAYWEFDETLKYEITVEAHPEDEGRPVARVRGNSWTSGEVLWDGSVAGHIDLRAQSGEEGDEERTQVFRRTESASLTGEWITKGAMWKSLETTQDSRTYGRKHDPQTGRRSFQI